MSAEEVKAVLVDTLGLDGRADQIDAETRLFGSLPELDSMAVLELVTALEDRFGIKIEADELTADTFETLGSLSALVEKKRS